MLSWRETSGQHGMGQSQEKLMCEKKRGPHWFLYFSFNAFLLKPPCSSKDLGWSLTLHMLPPIHSLIPSCHNTYWQHCEPRFQALGLTADLKTPDSNLLFQLEPSPDVRLSTPQANFLDTHKTLYFNSQNAEKNPRTQKLWVAQPASTKSSHAKSGPQSRWAHLSFLR